MRLPPLLLAALLLLTTTPRTQVPAQRSPFPWPNGKRAAVSLSFDDGRPTQMDAGMPVLAETGLKVTFYVVPSAIEKRQTAWRAAAQAGHEIGNHSLMHACTGNFGWSRQKALEDYTLPRMDAELEQAGIDIKRITGVLPTTFAYPCGQTFIGRGATTTSYVPLIARRFLVGRLWMGETANDPAFVDLAQVHAVPMDDRELAALKPMLDGAAEQGRWLVLGGHDIGTRVDPYTTRVAFLRDLAGYLNVPERGFWVAPVGTVAEWVATHR